MMAAEPLLGLDPQSAATAADDVEELEALSLDSAAPAPILLDPLLNPPPAPSSLPSSPAAATPSAAAAAPAADHPFTSFAEDEEDGIEFASPSPRRRNFDSGVEGGAEFVDITVTDPQKEYDPNATLVAGSSTFVSYLITTRAASGGGDYLRVRRRFRDVVALADRLAETHRGLFVPVRPDKGVVEGQVMQRQEFVEQRRVALERYLRRLAAHPVVGHSEELRAFFRSPGKVPWLASSVMSEQDDDGEGELPRQIRKGSTVTTATSPVRSGKDLFGMFRDLRQTVANGLAAQRPPPVEEEDDQFFLNWKGKLQDLEQQLTTTSQQAEALVRAQQDLGSCFGDLGMTLIKLAKFETENATCRPQEKRATEMRTFATAAVKASRLQRGLNTRLVHNLDTLHEYYGLMMPIHSAFADRSNALAAVQSISSDLYTLHMRAGKLESTSSKGSDAERSRLQKLDELKESIRNSEEAKRSALSVYENIKVNNRNEITRFDKERRQDFILMLKGFVVNQVGFSEKVASIWATAAEQTKGYARKTN